MATPTTGIPSGFNADTFRSAVRFAMQMGSPNSTQEKVTFRWKTTKDYAQEDPIDRPYDWTSTPISTTSHADVIADVAVEYVRSTGTGTTENVMGSFDTTRVTLTMLDVDFALVQGANQVLIGGDTYLIEYVQPQALFNVDVYLLHCLALDEK